MTGLATVAVKKGVKLGRLIKLILFVLVFLTVSASVMAFDVDFSSPKQTLNREVVTASWYGPRFHGRKTASGEVYNMYQISAAHRNLSFGTKLLLINPQNGRQLEVKITDRGPYVEGRDLDLSLGAAKALGVKEQGLTQLYAVVLD